MGGCKDSRSSVPDERGLIEDWKRRRCGRAIDLLVRRHRHLAYAAARRWTADPERIEDLAQEGVIGIIRAVDRYEPDRGMAFDNHCWLAARSAIEESAPSVLSVVDVPSYRWRGLRDGSIGDRERQALSDSIFDVASLDAPLRTGSATLADTLPADENIHERLEREDGRAEVRTRIETALSGLPARDAMVFRRRRMTEEPEPVEKLAADMEISRERVRNIEAKAVHFVRNALMLTGHESAAA